MDFFTKIQMLFRLSFRRKVLLLALVPVSLYSYLILRFFSEKAKFGKINKVVETANNVDRQLLKDISFAISIISKYSLWQNVCRHQAYQAKILCRFYKIPYTIFIGFKKNPEGQIEGHAWTMVNEQFVTGYCRVEDYMVQTTFS